MLRHRDMREPLDANSTASEHDFGTSGSRVYYAPAHANIIQLGECDFLYNQRYRPTTDCI